MVPIAGAGWSDTGIGIGEVAAREVGMFRIKICGVRSPEEAVQAIDSGADAIGLNFFPNSRRFVSFDLATRIASSVGTLAIRTGLFVGASTDTVRAANRQVGLDMIQLHGDEPVAFLRELRDLRLLKVFRFSGETASVIQPYLEECSQFGVSLQGVLVDAYDPSHYGGTGRLADWSLLREHWSSFRGLPIVLAGGLKPENVAEAIRQVRPHGVDVSSGVEKRPGLKDPAKVRDFCQAALGAFAEIA